jgi:putative NADH-flavin reductase
LDDMKLTVLGATGGVGRQLVSKALTDGHRVTAVVRDPARLGLEHRHLTVARADALDAGSLKAVVDGVDAVLSGVGAASPRDPLNPASTSTRAAVEAMAATDTRRIVVISAAPLNRSGAGDPWFTRRVFYPLLWNRLGELYTDLERMEAALAGSGLDWTAVRPPRLLDGEGTGRYRRAVDASPGGSSISRADVARAMLDMLADPTTIGHAIGVSS